MLLFLGAGASKPFGMPDMGELTDIVLNELKGKNINPSTISLINSSIKGRVEDFKIKPDIEAVLTCIDALCNPEKGIRDAGPFAALISYQRSASKLTFGPKKEDWCKLSEEIRKIIRRTCFFPSKKYMEELEKTYDTLFNIFDIKPRNPLNVFTTNYDLCFERYCKKKNYRLYDCFGDNENFDLEFRGAKGWQLYKLHGSSGWIITEECEKDNFTNSHTHVEIGEETLSGKMVTDVMIYPTSEKYFSKSPYFELLNRLRGNLKNSKFGGRGPCVVVGYSFRDIPINNAFIDAFEKEDYQCIIYIDKYASTNVEKNIIQKNLQLFHNLKYNPENIKYIINLKEDESNPPTMMSFADECCPTSGGFVCILLLLCCIIVLLMTIPSIILEWILFYYCLFTPAITFE